MLPALLLFCILFSILRSLSQRFLHLTHIPGPKWAAFGRFWMVKTLASGDSAAKYVNVNKQFGMH